jgi:hypothetical protein
MKQFLLLLLIFFSCSKDKPPTSLNQFGLDMSSQAEDTNGDKKPDAIGYYIEDSKSARIVYQELDKNADGLSDSRIWTGMSSASPPNQKAKVVVKVHEEEDTNLDGNIDTLRWMLPNNYVALEQVDKDKDGYFETTVYYNFKKEPVRTEKDTNFDGKPDIVIWKGRAELDSDFDGVFDKHVLGESNLALEAAIEKKEGLLPLKKEESWFMNRKLVPEQNQAMIGGGL